MNYYLFMGSAYRRGMEIKVEESSLEFEYLDRWYGFWLLAKGIRLLVTGKCSMKINISAANKDKASA